MLVFLMPELAVDHKEPNASPLVVGLDTLADLMVDVLEFKPTWVWAGAGTEVK